MVVQLSDLPQLVWLKVVCCSLKISGRLDNLEKLDVYDQGPKGSFSPPGTFTLKVEEKLPALGLVGVPKGYQRDESTEKIIRYRRHRK